MTAAEAIARSVSHTEIVTVDLRDSQVHTDLLTQCDDWVENGNVHEFWGTTEDGDEWRVHVRWSLLAKAKYTLRIEGEGDTDTVEVKDDEFAIDSAIEQAERLIAAGDYDLEPGETITVRYWLTREGDEQGDSRTLVLEG